MTSLPKQLSSKKLQSFSGAFLLGESVEICFFMLKFCNTNRALVSLILGGNFPLVI